MDIVVLSGGSGNDALIRGLVKLYPDVNVKVITNAYDNGKSTGVCRAVTNTLGVSDIRKNHSRLYEALTKEPDKRLLEFYNGRYDLTPGKEETEVGEMLISWGLDGLIDYVHNFFKKAGHIEFKNFSIANIVYSEMYSEIGYEMTNSYFCNLLGLKDFVLLNSFDNAYLKAITENYNIIDDEGIIVDWKNKDDKIINTFYTGDVKNSLNQKAIDAVMNCDLILISTGTFWSSIYPTLQYGDFYKFVNDSKAKKIWAIDNEEDKDSYGVTSTMFINYMKKLGLDLSKFTILENEDACESLKKSYKGLDVIKKPMDNNKGKHNGDKFAKEVLKIYYNLNDNYDRILFDFDDTIWARQQSEYSVDNLKMLSKLKNADIVSGNTFDSMRDKLYSVFGTSLDNCPNIWADANSILYSKGLITNMIDEHSMDSEDVFNAIDILKRYNIKYNMFCGDDMIFNIKIKPLTDLERDLLSSILNASLKNSLAIKTGKTTVDIEASCNSKKNVLKYYNSDKILYIGDECDSGNDRDIAYSCTNHIQVADVKETNTLLKLLLEDC